MLDTPCQTTGKTRTQPLPLAESLLKIIIRSQTPQNTPLYVVLPTRKQDPTSSTRTQASVSYARKLTWPTEPYPLGARHQKRQELQTWSLRKGDLKHSKLSKMRRQRNTQQMKEQGKNPPDQKGTRKLFSVEITWRISGFIRQRRERKAFRLQEEAWTDLRDIRR